MNRENETKLARDYFKACGDTLVKKANDYAQDDNCFSNFEKIANICELPVEKVFLVFMAVKVCRLVELTKKKNLVNESKQDSLMDISNYSCLHALWLEESKK